ncbi:hypothetical protein DLAC_02886 [Tieghemostelium lacteum]|uniref:NadR/Ttd14 AAA domain-containing protein n=1 Tax=Tieghemostelium lacteum TaxID=361077 RepID=A0A152A3J0_TIELA|nr:hypothetical protein DLAC_02886 [Tieghemostelium lacteum]|eukprot:KYR00832.1 hypothetical protein DLAC_02886 [Tieghemostelium lacteum]
MGKKICIIGGESTGKTTLAENLAKHFNSDWVPEYARIYLDNRDFSENPFCENDFIEISKGQIKLENETFSKSSNKNILFCDTCPLITSLWSNFFIGKTSEELNQEIKKSSYDLYLLLDCNIDWISDELRFIPNEAARQEFQANLIAKLNLEGIKFELITDKGFKERESKAIELVKKIL